MYAYIVDNKISELYPSDNKGGKCIKMPDDFYMSENHDYKYDPETDSIVEDLSPPGPPTPTQAEFDEFNLNVLRSQRNQLLYETDWVVTRATETGEPEPADWKKYRQDLRDITKTYKNQREVVWPTPPS